MLAALTTAWFCALGPMSDILCAMTPKSVFEADAERWQAGVAFTEHHEDAAFTDFNSQGAGNRWLYKVC